MKGVFEVSDTQKPIATKEDVQKIGALLQFFGVNIYRTESGLFRADPHIWALTELGRLSYKVLNDALLFGGGEPAERLGNRKNYVKPKESQLIAKQISDITMNLASILQVTKQELSIKLGQTKTYLKNLPGIIRNNRIRSYKVYNKLLDWHNNILDELKNKVNDVKVKTDFMNIYDKLKSRVLRWGITELYQQFSVYKHTIESKGFKLYTTFSKFLIDILKNKVEPSKVNFQAWCQIEHHPSVSSRLTRASRLVCKFCNQYTSYFDLKFTVESNGYTLKEPHSMKQWIDMILKRRTSPHSIKIVAICPEHGEFDTTYGYQNREIMCKKCATEARSLSLNEIKKRGEFYGLTLSRSMTIELIRERLANKQPLEWLCELGHRVEVLPFPANLKTAYCDTCAGGKITDERKVRYMLNRMFHTYESGKKPVNYYNIERLKWENIIKNKKVSTYVRDHRITKTTYTYSHMDYLIENFEVKGKYQNGKTFNKKVLFGIEVWENHHEKDSIFYAPRVSEYDGLKQILYEEGFIDLLVVVKTYKLKGREYRDFIIKELKRQLMEKFGLEELDINIGSISINRVLRHLRQNMDNTNYKIDKWA